MFKKLLLLFFYIILVVILIPFFITFFIYKKDNSKNLENSEKIEVVNSIEIEENIQNDKKFEINNLDEYIIGVVAAEMPISFEMEALKAQAVAARTYAYRRIKNINDFIDPTKIGQAYNSIEQMKQKWGNNFNNYYNKVKDAVYLTSGIVMTYNNEPIEAVFHSTSAGVTEVSENIWGKNLPYIQSVDSKVDENAPNFTYTIKIENDKFIKEISKKFPKINKNKIIDSFKITKRSSADYVLEVDVLGNKLTGREVRTMFNLRSTNFTIKKNKDGIEFTTKGYGHGAGMSQYGANFMAKDGNNYIDILNHYYVGVSLDKVY